MVTLKLDMSCCSVYHSDPAYWYTFFFNATATTDIYTLSLHDALPISVYSSRLNWNFFPGACRLKVRTDRKSTRLNSSHSQISYAVFCLKKKKPKCIRQFLEVRARGPQLAVGCQPRVQSQPGGPRLDCG